MDAFLTAGKAGPCLLKISEGLDEATTWSRWTSSFATTRPSVRSRLAPPMSRSPLLLLREPHLYGILLPANELCGYSVWDFYERWRAPPAVKAGHLYLKEQHATEYEQPSRGRCDDRAMQWAHCGGCGSVLAAGAPGRCSPQSWRHCLAVGAGGIRRQ